MSTINVTQQTLLILNQYGFFTLVLPFLLIFSIVYLITDYTKILKENDNDTIGKRLTIVFSFAFSWLALANQQLVVYLINFLPNAAFWLLAILLFIMVLGLYRKSESQIPDWIKGLAFLIAVLVMIALAINALGIVSGPSASSFDILGFIIDSGLIYVIIMFVILIAIMAWMTSPGKSSEESSGETEAANPSSRQQ